ncbi:MAG TPA: TonB C-terminal domain-containing protein [Candidatus Acidoferrales bacterium]|nr:TonB C-terminal domain-containing protein [Candidatus Acidoferrales bacterium]
MDDRTVVPSGLSDAPPLDGKTNIPAYLPLGVLVNRTLVPRGMPAVPIERLQPIRESVAVAVLDSRVVVPAYVEPADAEEQLEFEHAPEMTDQLREVIEPDIFMTGDANLLMEAKDKRDPKSDLLTRVLSVIVHVGLIIFLIFIPKIFPPHVPTQEDIDLARKQLQWIYSPPDLPKTAPPPSPKLHITAKTLSKISPKIEQPVVPTPIPAPAPAVKPPPDLPEAPRPQAVIPQQTQPTQPAPSRLEPVPPPSPAQGHLNLGLHDDSPGKQIEDQIQDAIRHGQRGAVYPGGQSVPGSRGGPGMGQQAQILSDTQGVDFTNYIQRLLATLKRNWDAIMPESAMMGERGLTSTTFKILPNGSVVPPDPILERTSGKEPLDNAAMSAIHASNPFEPLPSQFHGPYLELRIWFDYNIPLDQLNSYR